jgi:hypothetical protein
LGSSERKFNVIIGISGLCIDSEGHTRSAGSGKGEAAKRLIEKHGFVEIAWADPIKRFLQELYEFTDAQLWGTQNDKAQSDLRYVRMQAGALGSLCDNPNPPSPIFLTARHAMQTLGTGWGRACYKNTWVDYGIRTAKKLMEDHKLGYTSKYGLRELVDTPTARRQRDEMSGVVFTDVRYPNEFSAVRKAGGKVIRVTRTLLTSFDLDGMDHEHTSETELSDYNDSEFDYAIDNFGGIQNLYAMVDTMMDVFKGKIRAYDESQADVPPFLRKRG